MRRSRSIPRAGRRRWRSPRRRRTPGCRRPRSPVWKRCAPPSRALQRVQRTAVRLYDAAGRQREADRVLADLARDRRRDTDLMHQLSIRARRRGDGDEARTRLAAVVALRPDIPSLEIELGRLLEGAGEAQRALATLRALADRLPDEAGGAGRARQAAAPAGQGGRGAGAAAHGAGAAAAGSRAEALPRSPGAPASTTTWASPTSSPAASPRTRCTLLPPRAAAPPPIRPAAARSCCSTGASCACTATACRGRSPSASSRC